MVFGDQIASNNIQGVVPTSLSTFQEDGLLTFLTYELPVFEFEQVAEAEYNYRLINNGRYVKITNNAVSFVTNASDASLFTIVVPANTSNNYKYKVCLRVYNPTQKFNSTLKLNTSNNRISALNSTNILNDQSTFFYCMNSKTDELYDTIEAVYYKYYNEWVRKQYISQFFNSIRIIDMQV